MRVGCRFSGDVEVDGAPSAAEGLLFAQSAIDVWMVVFWAGLMGEQDQFFCAVSFVIDVDDELESDVV